jgi:hypothetical protein
LAYHAKVVPVWDSENKRTQNASISANLPNRAKNWHICSCVLLPWSPKNFVNSGILVPMGIWVLIESTVVWSPIRLHPMGHVNFEFISECPSYLL